MNCVDMFTTVLFFNCYSWIVPYLHSPSNTVSLSWEPGKILLVKPPSMKKYQMNNLLSLQVVYSGGSPTLDIAENCGVLLINLDRSPDRLEAATQVFANVGIEPQRVPGIDARLADLSEFPLDRKSFARNHGRSLIHPGEIGCYQSHLKALRVFLESGKPFGLILEDDTVPEPWLPDTLSTLFSWSDDWDIVPLFHFHRGGPVALRRADGMSLTVFFGPVSSAAAYLVNRRAAAVLVEDLATMRACVDHALFTTWRNGLRLRGVTPMAIGLAAQAQVSTINNIAFKKPFVLLRLQTFLARIHVALRIVLSGVQAILENTILRRSARLQSRQP
jgi:glycosyl transferase family 25